MALKQKCLRRTRAFEKRLAHCSICPRVCAVDRVSGAHGYCHTGRFASVSHHCLHHGEEPPISGTKGSGTIFFSRCNMHCVFCQNHEISQGACTGQELRPEELAQMMLDLQSQGVHNINFVSPSHVASQIAESVVLARRKGLTIPLVYNSNGYDRVETLRALEGLIDIYLPDCKYSSNEVAARLSDCPDYWDIAKDALQEMYRQVGNLILDKDGIAQKGLLVRHLVLPHGLAGTQAVLEFIAKELSAKTYISIMAQYHPCHGAKQDKQLGRRLKKTEYSEALQVASCCGFSNVYSQELVSADLFLPDFSKEDPFASC
jgi:putative pyruvate formate lyase activating enzyme